MHATEHNGKNNTTRREFLKTSSKAVAASSSDGSYCPARLRG